jgi:hypothetical protein
MTNGLVLVLLLVCVLVVAAIAIAACWLLYRALERTQVEAGAERRAHRVEVDQLMQRVQAPEQAAMDGAIRQPLVPEGEPPHSEERRRRAAAVDEQLADFPQAM